MQTKTKIKIGVGLGLLFFLVGESKGNSNTLEPKKNGGNGEGANESFLDSNESVRGIRNNNLGNIKYQAGNHWKGKVSFNNNTDNNKTFEQFNTLAYGTRAMIVLLNNYIKKGRNTVKKIIEHWDLGNPSYTAYLVTRTGFTENQVLPPNDKQTLKALVQAMSKIENGWEVLTDERFEYGYALFM